MAKKILAGDLMTRGFVSVSPDTDLFSCAKMMIKNKVGSLVVQKDKKLAGMLTERDILWAMMKKSREQLKQVKAEDIAIKKVKAIKPETDVEEAFNLMSSLKIRWLPVVYDGVVVGLLTLKDILKFVPTLFGSISEFSEIREETEKIKRKHSSMNIGEKEGYCEECGNFDYLALTDERFLCEPCRDSM